jgi:hypothetical protein
LGLSIGRVRGWRGRLGDRRPGINECCEQTSIVNNPPSSVLVLIVDLILMNASYLWDRIVFVYFIIRRLAWTVVEFAKKFVDDALYLSSYLLHKYYLFAFSLSISLHANIQKPIMDQFKRLFCPSSKN